MPNKARTRTDIKLIVVMNLLESLCLTATIAPPIHADHRNDPIVTPHTNAADSNVVVGPSLRAANTPMNAIIVIGLTTVKAKTFTINFSIPERLIVGTTWPLQEFFSSL